MHLAELFRSAERKFRFFVVPQAFMLSDARSDDTLQKNNCCRERGYITRTQDNNSGFRISFRKGRMSISKYVPLICGTYS